MPCCRRSVRKSRLEGNAKKGGAAEKFHYAVDLLSTGDTENAIILLKTSAEDGYADACYLLGGMYHNGIGVAKDTEEAERLYGRAAEQGHRNAQAELTMIGQERKKDI